MPGPYTFKFFLLINLFLLCGSCVFAQKDPIERLWYNEEKTAKIEIYKAADSKLYGKIIWLKEPLREGRAKIDIHNPDASKRNNPIIGLVILKGFKKDGKTEYHDGTIYDPLNGKNYSCKMYYKGDKLEVRGYYGLSIFGRSTTWTKAEE